MTFVETRCLLTPCSHKRASGFCPTLSEQEFDPAAAMVLHAWNQKLEARVHVHSNAQGFNMPVICTPEELMGE